MNAKEWLEKRFFLLGEGPLTEAVTRYVVAPRNDAGTSFFVLENRKSGQVSIPPSVSWDRPEVVFGVYAQQQLEIVRKAQAVVDAICSGTDQPQNPNTLSDPPPGPPTSTRKKGRGQ